LKYDFPKTDNVDKRGRHYHSSIWTGDEMIVFGGKSNDEYLNSGWSYNVNTKSYSSIPEFSKRAGHAYLWTGNEMIVWGGNNSQIGPLNTGGRYNPITDTWINTTTLNSPLNISGL